MKSLGLLEREGIALYLGVCTFCQSQFIDDLLHSLLPLFIGHVGWQTERSREVEILTDCECAHHDVILETIEEKVLKHKIVSKESHRDGIIYMYTYSSKNV